MALPAGINCGQNDKNAMHKHKKNDFLFFFSFFLSKISNFIVIYFSNFFHTKCILLAIELAEFDWLLLANG